MSDRLIALPRLTATTVPVLTADEFNWRHVAGLLGDHDAALLIRTAIPRDVCAHYHDALVRSDSFQTHDDVTGVSVFGLSHYQAARDRAVASAYRSSAHQRHKAFCRLAGDLSPTPFDLAIDLLQRTTRHRIETLSLPSEGMLAPFTARLYQDGAGIEPHVDILAVESPGDATASSFQAQLAVNCFLSASDQGGDLILYETGPQHGVPSTLDSGPHGFDPSALATGATVTPKIGDIVMFRSERIHAVSSARGTRPRLTLSFFVGVQGRDDCRRLSVWA